MANRDQVQVDSPVAYFRKLLKERSAANMPQSPLPSTALEPALMGTPSKGVLESKDDAVDPAAGRAMAKFEALPSADRARLLDRFAETLKGPLKKAYETQGLGSPMIRGSLAGWLARNG